MFLSYGTYLSDSGNFVRSIPGLPVSLNARGRLLFCLTVLVPLGRAKRISLEHRVACLHATSPRRRRAKP